MSHIRQEVLSGTLTPYGPKHVYKWRIEAGTFHFCKEDGSIRPVAIPAEVIWEVAKALLKAKFGAMVDSL